MKDRNNMQIINQNGRDFILEGRAKIITKKITENNQKRVEEQVFKTPSRNSNEIYRTSN